MKRANFAVAPPRVFLGLMIALGLFAALVGMTPMSGALAQQQRESPALPRERNVVLVLVDGLRWQEVFTGAEEALISKEAGGVPDFMALRRQFWRDTPEARRETLLPFIWNTVAAQGQLIGNQAKGSVARVSNLYNVSYPGYAEMLCGFADPVIVDNARKHNPNITVLEWLHGRPGFEGEVAAFGAWDVVEWIVNKERCGFFVNTGWEPLPEPADGALSERARLLNELKTQLPRRWIGEPDDAITFHTALEYLKQRQPRVVYLTFGETDEFAHEGRYDLYLQSANKTDGLLRTLWETLQSIEQYRDNTTLIVACDHGRGSGPEEWKNHNKDTTGSQFIWIAMIGPDVDPKGERAGEMAEVIQAQIAATVAMAAGGAKAAEDFCAAQPLAAKPIAGVFRDTN